VRSPGRRGRAGSAHELVAAAQALDDVREVADTGRERLDVLLQALRGELEAFEVRRDGRCARRR
jgi:hypothetical protein